MQKFRWLVLCFVILMVLGVFVHAADAGINYLEPKILTGTIYADNSLNQVLFTLRRTATNSGSTIRALREFNLPNGTLAARERVVYESGQLKSFLLEELQTGAKGSAVVESVGGSLVLKFNYFEGPTKKTGSEKFGNEILTSDMVGPYMSAHWDMVLKGEVVKCRLISVSRAETVGFKFFKESETTWHGKPALLVKMQPSSFIIARLVAPLHFVIEKESPHRVMEYTGRTTPSIRKDGKWDDLDAVTVFDWSRASAPETTGALPSKGASRENGKT